MFLPNKTLWYFVLFLLVGISVYNTYQAVSDIVALANTESESQKEIVRLEEKKQELQKRLEVVNSDLFVEKEARTRLNMKKEGEELYVIPGNFDQESRNSDLTQAVLGSNTTQNRSNFEKWLEILF